MSFLPSKLKIRGTSWKIKREKDPQVNGHQVYGYCHYTDYTIVIAKDLSPRDELETFIHEYIHACAHEGGIHDEKVPSWVEHLIINMVAKDMANSPYVWSKIFDSFIE